METQADANEEMTRIKDMHQQLKTRIDTAQSAQLELIASLQTLDPSMVSSIDLSMKVLSSYNGIPYTPLPQSLPNPNPNRKLKRAPPPLPVSDNPSHSGNAKSQRPKPSHEVSSSRMDTDKFTIDESGGPLSVVRSVVAVCLLERVPFEPIDSSTVLLRLENGQSATPAEKAALRELGGELGAILAVEMALRSMAEDNGGVELEEFVVDGKSRVRVMAIDRSQLVKELPESKLHNNNESNDGIQMQKQSAVKSGGVMGGPIIPRPMQDMWMGHHLPGLSPMFPGQGSLMGPRGGPRAMGGGMMVMPSHRPPMGMNTSLVVSSNAIPLKAKTEEDELKDLEALLNKKSFRESQKSKTGEELLDLIRRPTARETAVAAKFKTKGGSQLKEYCTALTKEDCRRQCGSYIACEKVHFRRIIAPHTDLNLGDCSFLDTCRHMKTCKYVHYELDNSQEIIGVASSISSIPRPLKPQKAYYCSEVELGESQWINCDIRSFRMDVLGQFGVIMADPPWDIHMELPYGTMADDEMRSLNVPALQTDGLIFLWVTGRAMELGRECLELWGYKRVEELIWVKTNQLQRIIRTGRTGHWLNHSKEHCLIGIKGNPEVNRNIDTDVVVAEVRETSRKPDEMYPMLERISPRTRKLELFARMHNTHAGWMSLGNQLSGVRLVDDGLRARFKAAYPDVEVQPASPPPPPRPSSSPSPTELGVGTGGVIDSSTSNIILKSPDLTEGAPAPTAAASSLGPNPSPSSSSDPNQ
ncbi:N6-adenosine-methyltransferase MT-A70-like [Impatiens glandulifera]|uniref:N6-adenosine-methyltransferase MT-A70-like n=1 Tax=Impatiens glandulifera TaxID=253017 RepID=UPI001FB0BDB4|nr:N6-adenosine-methyltransferase MT-A70-like [Impatiens glandulifera]